MSDAPISPSISPAQIESLPGGESLEIVFVEKEPYEKGFSAIFEKDVKPKLQPLEQKRIELQKEYEKRKRIAIPAIILIVGLFIFAVSSGWIPFNRATGFFCAMPILGVLAWMAVPVNEYKKLSKESIIPEILKFFGTFSYAMIAGINVDVLRKSKIMHSFDSYANEDYMKGSYKAVGIELNEATLTERQGKHTATVFHGQLIRFTLNKKFMGQTVVASDKGRVGNFFGSLFSGSMKKVALEDPKFESLFEVHSTEQIEARYLLTTAFMERLIQLSELYKNKNIQCSFFDDTLFIAIPSTLNLFEPGPINKTALQTDDIHTFLGQMHYIFEIVDLLNLTSKTGF